MAFDEDFTQFLDTNDFAVDATFDGTAPVVGIFRNAYNESEVGFVPVTGRLPVFSTPETDVPSPAGKTLLINAVTYTIVRSEPDGTGWTTLILQAP
jgi:hypothetical protein